MKMNKRGQGLSVNAIILVILGVAILVILIIGFTIGWGTLVPFLRTDNVDTIVKSCETSCSTQSKFSYCSKEMDLKTENLAIKTTCNILEKVYPEFGIEPCPIDCGIACADLKINGKAGVVGTVACVAGQKDVTVSASGIQTGQFCCI
ncbi:MAG TPA: hypothetical protein VJ438_03980 [Candidatus Nanoarchaeia archaeon]|nr:hypothetical protein [Candidatus Nanoarchaeia archaeon]